MTLMETMTIPDVHQIQSSWLGNMHFAASVNNHTIHIDKLKIHGGDDRGPRPKQLLLAAASGCVGMELVAILEKMRIKIESMEMTITGTLSESIPKIYKSIHLLFEISCAEEDRGRFEKALNLTLEKYCGVIAMFRHFAEVTTEVKYF